MNTDGLLMNDVIAFCRLLGLLPDPSARITKIIF
jgi:hypothetical protein